MGSLAHFLRTLLVAAAAGALTGAIAGAWNWDSAVVFAVTMLASTAISIVALRELLFGSGPKRHESGAASR